MTEQSYYEMLELEDKVRHLQINYDQSQVEIAKLRIAIHDIMDAWVAQQHHRAFDLARTALGIEND